MEKSLKYLALIHTKVACGKGMKKNHIKAWLHDYKINNALITSHYTVV